MKNQKAVFSQNAAMKLTTPSRQFFKPALATTLAIGSWRLVLLLATAVSLIGYPKPASAATVNVAIGYLGGLVGRFLSFVGDDPPWRSGEVGLAYERPQHHVRSPGDAQWHMGFWSS